MHISCYVIGGNSLSIACSELLLERGEDLRGIVASSPQVADWARARGLPLWDADQDYLRALQQTPFGYLFSIAHLQIIPEKVLELPELGAINFHDGILPRYAGLNVPVWALINGEPSHGVTWHMMTAEADAGDIVKQEQFEVSADDTAFRLNAKCFEAGIRTFGELVQELSVGGPRRIKQDLTQRRYFARLRRPEAACLLDWRASVVELERLVRALDFGGYANPVGSATIAKTGQACIVTKLEIAQEKCAAEPGTVVAISADRIQVAAGDGVVTLMAFANLDGSPIAAGQLASRLGLQIGKRLDVPTDVQRDGMTELIRQIAKSESFWAKRLAPVKRVDAMPAKAAEVDGLETSGQEVVHEFDIPSEFIGSFGEDSLTAALPAAFAAFVVRISDAGQVSLAVEDEELRSQINGFEAWASRRVPVILSIDLDRGLNEVIASWSAERNLLVKRGTWLRDLIGRSPELRTKPELKNGFLDVVGVQFVNSLGQQAVERDGSAPLLIIPAAGDRCQISYDPSHYLAESVGVFCQRFGEFLVHVAADPNKPLREVTTLTSEEEHQILVDWNKTETPYDVEACMHVMFEQQVERTPDSEAIVFAGQALSYRELNDRANRLAAHLRGMGVGPDCLVGVCVERSIDMVVAVLGVQKAGGAYVPLDPSFPANRIAFMMQDSRARIVITQSHLMSLLPASTASIVRIDTDWPSIAEHPAQNVESGVRSNNLAYVIYTSGSTGRPKGVMIEHRNAANFYAGMDQRIDYDPAGRRVWLAVTSLSFDISVLELFWTLARGFTVVLYSERHRPQAIVGPATTAVPMRFSLFYFSSDEQERTADKYRLLLEGAKFADQNGFVAVSTPERHFHAFGGLYPNPAVAGAAIAAVTERVQIRAGSVVLPLHHPIRVAEEWSLVDNLSGGRVGVSFASGWQPVDFVLRPEAYPDRHQRLYEGIEIVRRLWRGEALEFPDTNGKPQSIQTLPRPIQKELPTWVTTAGSPETWRRAGEIGANVLTHLLGQTVDEVAEKARLYREAYRRAGHLGTGYVTLMLHTFVGDSVDAVRELVRQPMKNYIGSSLSLVRNVASSWSAYKRRSDGSVAQSSVDLDTLSDEEMEGLLDFSFERYFETSGLFGTPDSCLELVRRLRGSGVDEIACLIDFGVDSETALAHLDHLNQLRMGSEQDVAVILPDAVPATGDETIGALIRRHDVTHLQCTPSMASLILADDEAREALSRLQMLLIGGEAFPVALARELRANTSATILNMYGPTETTIWSSTAVVRGDEPSLTIGRPIANTQLYVLDKHLRPVAVGEIGELYIGGDGVVRGYHERPDLTADRFLKNPYVTDPKARIYRTGDLARFRDNAAVEFLGRVDHQVKIRGYRIELGEIETALCEQPGIREAVVVAREDSPDDKRLVAYYVGRTPQPIAEADLRSVLRDRLPEYMVPSRFVAMSSLPQTPNKKVDRKALPAPADLSAAAAANSSSPAPLANDVEAKITSIWQELLGISQIGREDNFFDIGGHSLMAIQAHRRLKEVFDQDFAITDLFQFPTVSSFAAFVKQESNGTLLNESQQRGATRREMMMQRRGLRHQPVAAAQDDRNQ
jgi:natural product biosynthesis luciferase-like monooxygenase protein